MTARRLDRSARIDRAQPIGFSWDGRACEGFAGDTLASALLANDVGVIGRSFKYHRPRSVMSAGPEEAGAIVTLGSGAEKTPNIAASTLELRGGLQASGQNGWPSVRRDMGSAFGWFDGALSAGFYYKTFMGPSAFGLGRSTRFWKFCETFIRRAAGMGSISGQPDPDRYEIVHHHCDTLVIGGGASGLRAATEAASTGEDVLLVEQDFMLGGKLLRAPMALSEEQREALVLAAAEAGANLWSRTTALGIYDDLTVAAVQSVGDGSAVRQRFFKIAAKRIVLATGAIERFVTFANNDLPGIMPASSARAYLNRYAVLVGQRIVIATNNDSAYVVARELSDAGAQITLCDSRNLPSERLAKLAGPIARRIRLGTRIVRARGGKRVTHVDIAPAETSSANNDRLACDALLLAGGWDPTLHLLGQRGVTLDWSEATGSFVPPEALPVGIELAGSVRGRSDYTELNGAAAQYVNREKAFVDPINDVTVADIALARREGFEAPEHLKRYTTLGMGPNQGKIGAVESVLVSHALDGKWQAPIRPTTTSRPPFTPVSLGALAGDATGRHFVPTRRIPLHDWHLKHGAAMTEAGPWLRPWWYHQNGPDCDSASYAEAKTVRESVGMCDVSTLGKIEIIGPDSSIFVDRVFANAMRTLHPGKARYGVLLRDDGIVFDDGVIQRLEGNRYFFTTTTANSGSVLNWLEELLQTRWPELRVCVTSMTDQWAAIAIAGPRSTRVVSALVDNADTVATTRLPFMGLLECTVNADIRIRVARVSFSGERAYELYVGARSAEVVAEQALALVEKHGGVLYGLEALDILRIEKGHASDGEIDGRTTMADLGLGAMASRKKHYVGKVLAGRPALVEAGRPALVGVRPLKPDDTIRGGAILMKGRGTSARRCGWLTTAVRSPAIGSTIALGFIEGGPDMDGASDIFARDPVHQAQTAVEIVSPQFFDPDNTRLKANDD